MDSTIKKKWDKKVRIMLKGNFMSVSINTRALPIEVSINCSDDRLAEIFMVFEGYTPEFTDYLIKRISKAKIKWGLEDEKQRSPR